MSNPLIEKYEELHQPKPEPQKVNKNPTSYGPTAYEPDAHSIKVIEGILNDLKSGKAHLLNYNIEKDYNHIPPTNVMDRYSSAIQYQYPIHINRGYQIKLEIFRTYDTW